MTVLVNIDGEDIEMTAGQAEAIFGPSPVVLPEPPAPISPRQFFVGMTKTPWQAISEVECAAMLVARTIPAPLVTALDLAESNALLPDGMSRFDVEMLIVSATEFRFDNPVSEVVSGLLGWTEQERRDFWAFAASL